MFYIGLMQETETSGLLFWSEVHISFSCRMSVRKCWTLPAQGTLLVNYSYLTVVYLIKDATYED